MGSAKDGQVMSQGQINIEELIDKRYHLSKYSGLRTMYLRGLHKRFSLKFQTDTWRRSEGTTDETLRP